MPSRGWFIIQFICTVFEQALKTLFLTQLEQAEEAGNITPLGISRRSLTCNNTQFSELLMACDKKKTDLPVATPVKFKPTEVILGVEFNLGSWGLSTNTQQFHSNRLSDQKFNLGSCPFCHKGWSEIWYQFIDYGSTSFTKNIH